MTDCKEEQNFCHTILVVDDNPEKLVTLGELPQPYYYHRVRAAVSGTPGGADRRIRVSARSDLARYDDARQGRLCGEVSGALGWLFNHDLNDVVMT